MSWALIVVLVVSFAWMWSRWLASDEAWKNDYVDFFVGLIAVGSWFVNALDLALTPNLSQQLALEYSMLGSLGLVTFIVIFSGIWGGLTWIFARFRVKVAKSERYND